MSNATESPKPGADQRRSNAEHLAHPRSALGPFVANHHHVVVFDLAGLHGLKGIFLAIENPRRTACESCAHGRRL